MNAPRPIALLSWSLYVTCPACQERFDLMYQDADREYTISNALFQNRWHDLEGCEVECLSCRHEFELGGIEY